MIKLRNIEERDKEMYVIACRQEPGCESFFSKEIYMDMLWSIVNKGRKRTYAISNEEDDFIGYISSDGDDIPEIGISLLPEFQGKGLGVKAYRLLMDQINKDSGVSVFTLRIDPTNEYCIKMVKKLGGKRVDSRPSSLMKGLEKLINEDESKKIALDGLSSFNNSVLRYDLYYEK